MLSCGIPRFSGSIKYRLLCFIKYRVLCLSKPGFLYDEDNASTISGAVVAGVVIRAGRGLYQLPGIELELESTLAEASLRVPRGVICMTSALAYHQLTDQLPRIVWIAIGAKNRKPFVDYPPLRIVRFRSPYLEYGVERHRISGIDVPTYSIAKSLANAFRNRRLVDRSVAAECLRNACVMP